MNTFTPILLQFKYDDQYAGRELSASILYLREKVNLEHYSFDVIDDIIFQHLQNHFHTQIRRTPLQDVVDEEGLEKLNTYDNGRPRKIVVGVFHENGMQDKYLPLTMFVDAPFKMLFDNVESYFIVNNHIEFANHPRLWNEIDKVKIVH